MKKDACFQASFFILLRLVMIKKAIIGLGSNLGDRAQYLERAKVLIGKRIGNITRMSSVSETEAWGFTAPPFLNQIIELETALEPMTLLDALQEIERELGRTQKTCYIDGKAQYHNRTIDLDILDYDHQSIDTERLTLPHPRIQERDFVLNQLQELEILL